MEKIKPYNYQEREHRYRSYSDFKFLLLHAELKQSSLCSPALTHKVDGEAGMQQWSPAG